MAELDDASTSSSSSTTTKEPSSSESGPPRRFTFPDHASHVLSLAKMLKEGKMYTDCVLQCSGGKHRAHRLVLSNASPFLKGVFRDTAGSAAEPTVVLPGVSERVVAALLDFLYTGEMRVEREDTADMQTLIDILQIDPQLISVEEEAEEDVKSKKEEVGEVVTEKNDKGEDDLTDKEGEENTTNNEEKNEGDKNEEGQDDFAAKIEEASEDDVTDNKEDCEDDDATDKSGDANGGTSESSETAATNDSRKRRLSEDAGEAGKRLR